MKPVFNKPRHRWREWLKQIDIVMHLYRIYHDILQEDLNQGQRWKCVKKYFKWHFYFKRKKQTQYIVLQNGMRSIVYPDSDSGVSHIYTKNVDYHETEFVRGVLEKDEFIIDGGCNIGNRTLALADIIGGGLLIEPNPLCGERLLKHFRLNNISIEKYYFCRKALGRTLGTVQMTDFGGTSCCNKIVKDGMENLKTRPVEMTTIDYEMEQLGFPVCAYIKLDLEGYDLDALYGAKETLKRCGVRLIQFERWKEGKPLQEFHEFFKNMGWTMAGLDKSKRILSRDKCWVEGAPNLFAVPDSVK